MIKIVAISMTIVSSIAFGTALYKSEKEKISEIEELTYLVLYIHNGIEKLSLPLGDIFNRYFSENEGSVIEKKFKERRGTYGEKLLFVSKEICSPSLCSEIEMFAKNLGSLDRDMQIKSASNASRAFVSELENARNEFRTKGRLYQILSVLAACVITVLLY